MCLEKQEGSSTSTTHHIQFLNFSGLFTFYRLNGPLNISQVYIVVCTKLDLPTPTSLLTQQEGFFPGDK